MYSGRTLILDFHLVRKIKIHRLYSDLHGGKSSVLLIAMTIKKACEFLFLELAGRWELTSSHCTPGVTWAWSHNCRCYIHNQRKLKTPRFSLRYINMTSKRATPQSKNVWETFHSSHAGTKSDRFQKLF